MDEIVLTPAQERGYQDLLSGISVADVLTLQGRTGAGKTTILQKVQAATGGVRIGMREFIDSLAAHSPSALEEAFVQMMDTAMGSHATVILDDLHLVQEIVENYRYPRADLMNAAITAVLDDALRHGRKLIFGCGSRVPDPVRRRAWSAEIGEFTPEDYRSICGPLLDGPPGTGKTTIGRALAHRLKGKFFLIDGTVVAGSSDFYCQLDAVFNAAKKNAPSVVFLDDADVIFEGEDHGFYRYLLTLLDGLESASAERVCLMLTAMHPGALPPALLRSGRVELWLEVSLPDGEARQAILRERLEVLPEPLRSADAALLASVSRNLTGADLKNIVEDGKLLFAHDRLHGRPLRPVNDYFLDAVETVRKHHREYARSKPPKVTEPVPVGFGA